MLRQRSLPSAFIFFATISSLLCGCGSDSHKSLLGAPQEDAIKEKPSTDKEFQPSPPTTASEKEGVSDDTTNGETAAVKAKVLALYDALQTYVEENGSSYTALFGLDTQPKELCFTGIEPATSHVTDCSNKLDLRILVPNYITEIPTEAGSDGHEYLIGLSKIDNGLSIVVNGQNSSEIFSINPTGAIENNVFTTPGTYSFKVPEGVNEIAAILIGGGGGGGHHAYGSNNQGGGGGGGGLRYGRKISVASGEILTVIVGAGGNGGGLGSGGANGGDSSLKRVDEALLVAEGGKGGTFNWPGGIAAGGTGTPFSDLVTGGNGGKGAGPEPFNSYRMGLFGAGGGGAGGYRGNGGDGGGWGMTAQNGTGGGGGGGNISNWYSGGSGGGVGLEGEGASGIAGAVGGWIDTSDRSGRGGSGGESGVTNVAGGAFGGGGGGMGWEGTEPASGGGGAVKIMWRSLAK